MARRESHTQGVMQNTARQLRTANAVIDAIGHGRVREITGTESNVVTNWRARGRLSHFCYLIVTAELARLGYWAKPELWGITSPKVPKKRSGGRK